MSNQLRNGSGCTTLLGAGRLVPDVVGDGRGWHGEARFAGKGCSCRLIMHEGARRLGTEVNICGKRRRWTAEQKRQIVAEGLEPGMSAAMVARKARHQHRGSFMPGGNRCCCAARSTPEPRPCRMWRASMRRRARLTWSRPLLPRRSRTLLQRRRHRCRRYNRTTGSTCRCQMAWQQGGCARILALSTLLRPIVGAAHPKQSPRRTRGLQVRPTGSVRACRPVSGPRALRRFRHGDRVDRVDRTGWSPVPGKKLLKLVPLGFAGDQALPSTSVSQASGSMPFNFAVPIRVIAIAQCPAAPSDPANNAFFRATATPFMPRSTTLVSISSRPSSRNSTRPDQCRSV